jgi:hypothetical protein
MYLVVVLWDSQAMTLEFECVFGGAGLAPGWADKIDGGASRPFDLGGG